MVLSLASTFEPPFINFYSIAGRGISIAADSTATAQLFDLHLSGCYLKRGRTPQSVATIEVSDSARPKLPENLDCFELPSGGCCYTDWNTYHLVYDDSLVTVGGAVNSSVKAWTGGKESSRTLTAQARLVWNAVSAAARRGGLYELHAAGVVDPASGEGVLFIGPSGSAKSTLAVQLANAGWRYLSDDTLLLYQQDGGPRVHALRRAFSITKQTAAAGGMTRFTAASSRPVPFDPSKDLFDPHDVMPEAFVASIAPSVVIFPKVVEQAVSRVRRLSQPEAMASLICLCPWASFDRVAAHGYLDALANLVRNCTAYRLEVGADLFGDAEATATFIATLC